MSRDGHHANQINRLYMGFHDNYIYMKYWNEYDVFYLIFILISDKNNTPADVLAKNDTGSLATCPEPMFR